METEIRVHLKRDHIKISHFTKFQALWLDCSHVEKFQISKIRDFALILGAPFQNKRHLYGIWATFDKSQPVYYAMKHNQTSDTAVHTGSLIIAI